MMGATVRMLAESRFEQVFLKGIDGVVAVHVFLFIHGFQFRLEQAENGITETLHINVHPLGELVGGEGVEVHGLVICRACIQALAAHPGEDDVHLVGNGYH